MAKSEDETPPRGPLLGRRDALVGGAAVSVLAAGTAAALLKGGAPAGTDHAVDERHLGGTSSTTVGEVPAGGTSAPAQQGASISATAPGASSSTRPLTEAERTLHVARRFSLGPTPALLAEVGSAGPAAWLDRQLSPGSIADAEADAAIGGLDLLGRSASEIEEAEANRGLLKGKPTPYRGLAQLRHAAILRAVLSRRQLLEVMVDTWSDHLAIVVASVEGSHERVVHDREVLRRHALGTFRDLLHATAHSPAMLRSLDNHFNTAAGPNENYARELLEIHTIGAATYTEADVKNAAQVFSGWTFDRSHRFWFDQAVHRAGPVEVAGWRSEGQGGVGDGEALLDHLAAHPATARNVALRLCHRFVADDPPTALVDAVASTYLNGGTSIPAMIRTIVAHDAFWASYGLKARRGFELAATTLRACGARIDTSETSKAAQEIDWWLLRLGQRPYEPPSPAGFPDNADAWLTEGFVLSRWNTVRHLLLVGVPGIEVDLDGIFGPVADRPAAEALQGVLDRVLPGARAEVYVPAILDHLGVAADGRVPADGSVRSEALALCLSGPEVQVR